MLKNQLHASFHQILFAPKVESVLKETLATAEQNIEQLNDLTDEEHDGKLG